MSYPKLVENIIEKLTKLPGVGRRSAERMAIWFLNNSKEEAKSLCDAIIQLKERLMFCPRCNNLTEREICAVCDDPARDQATICVVENPKDLVAIERTGMYRGVYHVLLGTISPQDGRGPDDIRMSHLIRRVQSDSIKEVLIATDPDAEGETTALYIAKQLKPMGVRINRIGLGIPVGSSVEYVDLSTLTMSLVSKKEME